MKIERKPSTALLPTPVVLLSVAGHGKEKPNIITLAWVGTVCSTPPMLSVAIRPTRHSHGLVNAAREFVVNIPRADQVAAVDLAGVWSGVEHDKFAELGFTARPASQVAAPLIEECPLNIECVVRHQLDLGAHDLYLAEIVAVHYDEELIDSRGRLKTAALHAMAYVDGEYWSLGERLGSYGQAAKALRTGNK
ncbi:MAG: flavin reductase family protein [Actinobacteria bacterium]|nr:flavin reductase family protein [Actinomycetota bacterium]